MKVVSSKQMAYIESLAYRDGALESDFMEEAGSGVALVVQDFTERNQLDHHVLLLCGKGNNGGDAYVAGVHLLHLDYEVQAIQLAPINTCSELCQKNYHRFLLDGGRVQEVSSEEEFHFPSSGVIIDGIFGTGFHGEVPEPFASIIRKANESKLPIIAVDIPSGLNGETGKLGGEAVRAAETAFLTLPKTGFFLLDGWNHVGKLRYVDFGLSREYIDESESDFIMLTNELLKPILPPIVRNRHKYQRGFVVGLGGSPGMPGASLMSSAAALRGGAGIVKLLHPRGMEAELASSQVELIKIPYDPADIAPMIDMLNKASGVFIGPGMGLGVTAKTLLRQLLPNVHKPCVLDADALTILSEENIPFPEHTILTPHMGEMLRLLKMQGPQPLNKDFLQICQSYAENKRVTLILKGGPTFVFHPDEPITINPAGDPGMATAGSGDVLTGLLSALLAQGLTTHQAACLGVYIHGLAGECAAFEMTSYCVNASDILYYFPEGFRLLEL
jgi:ADP-dependent NAD(P)H-hydrate dehydratase / NAD(P)H-hydrate epimerase